jgi:lipoprotein-anchoring transpeptidase ErfK/SrfK
MLTGARPGRQADGGLKLMKKMKTWISSSSTVRVSLVAASACLILCLLGVVGFLFVQDATRWGKFPPHSKVAGVSVAGLSKADAVAKCQAELKEVESKPVTLTLNGVNYSSTAENLGLHLNYQQMVDEAYDRAWSPNVFERMFRSFVNRPRTVNELVLAENDNALVAAFVKSVNEQVNQPPHDAYVDVTSGLPVIVPARDGYSVPEATIRQEVLQAENSLTRTVAIKAQRTPAAYKDDIFGKLIVVNLSQHMLVLYNRQTPTAQFPIACGQPAYPTPVGQWRIVGKQMNPTWYNPHDAWSASMPDTIGPGYSNPLGLRALPLNASGVLIHGTSNDGSIGTSASHGCMRMHMPDVIKLFDMVEVGTPVYIIRAAGDPGFNVAVTPSWRKPGGDTGPINYTGD